MGISPYARKDMIVFSAVLLAPVALLCWVWPAASAAAIMVASTLWVAVALFFRDPERRVPEHPRVLVSPADGCVVEIAHGDEPHYLRQPAHRAAIFMSLFNVHVNRSPCDGRVVAVDHRPGRLGPAMRAEASLKNEANLISIHNTEVDQPVLVKQIAGLVARRTLCARAPGDVLARGETFGMVKLGSRVEVSVPSASTFQWRVKLGESVRAGETVLGEWEA